MEVLLKNNVNLHAKSIIQIFGIIWINIQCEFGQTVQDSGRCYCSLLTRLTIFTVIPDS